MATETTKDAVITVPTNQADKVTVVENPDGGTTAVFSAPTTNVSVDVTGSLVVDGSKVINGTFTFTEPGSLTFNNKVQGSDVKATIGDDSVGFDGKQAKKIDVKAGEGADSIIFDTNISNVSVDLGKDNSNDLISIKSEKDLKSKGLTIKNFGKGDVLEVGGKTYTYDELKNNNPFDKITIKFD